MASSGPATHFEFITHKTMKKYRNASDIRVGVIGYGGAFNMGRGHLKEMEQAGMTPASMCHCVPTGSCIKSKIFTASKHACAKAKLRLH